MYRYETHLHTAPVSKCARAGVRESLLFYKRLGYDGVFITNHFLDGNVNIDKTLPYETKLDFYVSDYYRAKEESEKIGIKVFFGVELSYHGTDFLIYGLPPEWYYKHPEIMTLSKKEELALMRSEGAFTVQAHPFREKSYLDHIRLFPRSVDAVEVENSGNSDFENEMADLYAERYGLPKVAGTDNHSAYRPHICGVECEEPIETESDYGRLVLGGLAHVLGLDVPKEEHEWILSEPEGRVSVQLVSNPSTGFGWEYEASGECGLSLESEETVAQTASGLCGTPAFVKYVFRPSSQGKGEIVFRYRRPRENLPPARTFRVRIEAKEDGKISLRYHEFEL